jgi:uncharacterized membrane protein
MVKKIKRWCVHAFTTPWRWQKSFPQPTLTAIELAIQQSESQHSGELRFVVENSLAARFIWQGLSSWQRALELFANLRVWDTEENCGVLIYLLLAERTVHIVADRGINKRVTQAQWDEIAQTMQNAFRRGNFQDGALVGIAAITTLLISHFPVTANKINQLPDTPVILH